MRCGPILVTRVGNRPYRSSIRSNLSRRKRLFLTLGFDLFLFSVGICGTAVWIAASADGVRRQKRG